MPHILNVVQRPEKAEDRKHHVLYVPAKKITVFDEALQNSVRDLVATMHYEQGIGIAAPQVGWSQQIFLIEAEVQSPRYPFMKKYSDLRNVAQQLFINPCILEASQECVSYWHGCLSAMSCDRGVLRSYKSIHVRAQDIEGKTFTCTLDSLAAIIFQHEFRHLLGTVYFDRARTLLPLAVLREQMANDMIQLYDANPDPSIPHMIGDYKVGETIEEFAERMGQL